MHTNTKRAHRLWVALPLLGIVFAASMSGAVPSAQRAQEVVAGASGVQILADGTVLKAEAGTLVDLTGLTPHMQAGTLDIASKSMWVVQCGAVRLIGLNGGARIVSQSGPITIAALTTPVLAQVGDRSVLVPAGMQLVLKPEQLFMSSDAWAEWMALRKPVALPQAFIAEQLPEVFALMEASVLPAADVSAAPSLSALQLPAALQRAQQMERVSIVSNVEQALERNDIAAFDRLMEQPATVDALRSGEAVGALPTLLSVSTAVHRQAAILPFFTQKPERQLLAQYHPLYREQAWLLTNGLSGEMQRLSLSLLPISDQQGEALTPSAVAVWSLQLQQMLRETQNPLDQLSQLLPILHGELAELSMLGHPERVRLYAQALLTLCMADGYRDHAEIADVCARISALHEEPIVITMPPLPAATPAAPQIPALDAKAMQERETQAEALLQQSQFMFLPQTHLTAKPDGFVEVKDIVLSTAKGDGVFSFRFDPVADRITVLDTDGKPLPFALPLAAYVKWVQGQ